MADPLTPTQSSEPAYRPLSGLTLVGFSISLIYAGLVAISALVGMVKGAPIFFPAWVLGLAILGLILSYLGLRQIQNSEGTRAGIGLARAGIWMALFAGLGYGAYYYVTGLALISQANDFLLDASSAESGFFPRLEKAAKEPAQLRAAYLLTLPEINRKGLHPDDEVGFMISQDQPKPDGEPGRFSKFKENPLVRAFGPGVQGQIKIEPLGVQSWDYENHSYKVVRNYRFRSPEIEMILRVPTESVEPEDTGKSRSWFVNTNLLGKISLTTTPLGNGLTNLRLSSRKFVEDWIKHLNEGDSYTLDLEATDWKRLLKSSEERDKISAAIQAKFKSKDVNRLPIDLQRGHDNIGDWQYSATKQIQILHSFRLYLYEPAAGVFEGYLVVQSKDPIDPATAPENVVWELANVQFTRIVAGDFIPKRRR